MGNVHQLPPAPPWSPYETVLYRHFDAEGTLLYVGISASALARTAQHMLRSHWSRRIATIKIERFELRADALAAEAAAIVAERPLFNVVGVPAAPAPPIDDAAEMEKLERFLAAHALRRNSA